MADPVGGNPRRSDTERAARGCVYQRIGEQPLRVKDDGSPLSTGDATPVTWRRWLAPASLVALLVVGGGWLWHAGVLHRISNKDHLIALLRASGARGALLCSGVQFLQVVIAVIPGEITSFAAGYVFGAWRGFVYSAIGVTLGSAFNFCFARVVGRPTLERLVGPETLDKLDRSLDNTRTRSAMFLLFLLPGLPKDLLCYAAGFSAMPVIEFVVLSGLARSPALLATVLIGAGVSRGDYRSLIATAVVLLLAIAGYAWYWRSRKEGGSAAPRN